MFTDDEKDFIDNLNLKFRGYRGVIFKPLLIIFHHFGLTADMLTNIRLFFGVVFLFWFYYGNEFSASLFLLFVLLMDTFDGALARFQNKASDRGKFLDILTDSIIYSFTILALFKFRLDFFLLAYNIFIIDTAYLLGTIKKQEFKKSEWIIRPYAQLSYLKAIVVVPFFLLIFFQKNFFPEAIILDNILATGLSIYYFIFIQIRWRKTYGG
ncbi:MAG: CDP-alcohol phosphatidyltransferase family protein [Patescibacteria group bacterium]|nr:CDP-alcohol phosphatidyltransferase family protein [Patescibacteria group bacterium]MDD5294821.1 CDP-alcohol phosphatidyltransferase family protein [Patescibacteria group bacterium]MDD5554790.1 CDP-alcohol phosphatidyltransferase family protein [Patescibacteria group bacterium]